MIKTILIYNDFKKEIEIDIKKKIGIIQENILSLCSLMIYNIENTEILVNNKYYILGSEQLLFSETFENFFLKINYNFIEKIIINDRKRDSNGNVIKENLIIDTYNKWYQEYEDENYITFLNNNSNESLQHINYSSPLLSGNRHIIRFPIDTLLQNILNIPLYNNLTDEIDEISDSISDEIYNNDSVNIDKVENINQQEEVGNINQQEEGNINQKEEGNINQKEEVNINQQEEEGNINQQEEEKENIHQQEEEKENIHQIKNKHETHETDETHGTDGTDETNEDNNQSAIHEINRIEQLNNIINMFDTYIQNNTNISYEMFPPSNNIYSEMSNIQYDYIDNANNNLFSFTSFLVNSNFENNIYEDIKIVLNNEQFESLPCNFYKDLNLNEIKECLICINNFNDEDEIIHLPCNHMFHKNCIKSWICEENNKCPVCRIEVAKGTPKEHIDEN